MGVGVTNSQRTGCEFLADGYVRGRSGDKNWGSGSAPLRRRPFQFVRRDHRLVLTLGAFGTVEGMGGIVSSLRVFRLLRALKLTTT